MNYIWTLSNRQNSQASGSRMNLVYAISYYVTDSGNSWLIPSFSWTSFFLDPTWYNQINETVTNLENCLSVCRDGSGAILYHIKLPESTCWWVKSSYVSSTTRKACSPAGIQFIPDLLVSKRSKLTSEFSVVESCEAPLIYRFSGT